MRSLPALFAVLACVAGVGTAAAATHSPAQPPTAEERGRYVERTQAHSAATVASVYRDALAHALADDWRSDPDGLKALMADPGRFRYMTFRTHWDVATGNDADGRWDFVAPAIGERWPGSAVHTIDRSTAEHFDVERVVHCAGAAEACDDARTLAHTLPIPRPSFGADAASVAQWRGYIETRTCTPGPVSTPAPPYPRAAGTRSDGGRVVLRLLVDPCGQVHDARVESPSGVTEFDRAAVRTARRWRVAMPAAGVATARGATLRVPIAFDVPPPDPPTGP